MSQKQIKVNDIMKARLVTNHAVDFILTALLITLIGAFVISMFAGDPDDSVYANSPETILQPTTPTDVNVVTYDMSIEVTRHNGDVDTLSYSHSTNKLWIDGKGDRTYLMTSYPESEINIKYNTDENGKTDTLYYDRVVSYDVKSYRILSAE